MLKIGNPALIIICMLSVFLFSGCGTDHYVVKNSYVNKTERISLKGPEKNWIMELTDTGMKIKSMGGANSGFMEYSCKKVDGLKKADEYIDEYIKNDFKSFSMKLKYKKKKVKIGSYHGCFAGFDGSFEYTPKSYGVGLIIRNQRAHILTYVFPSTKKKELVKYYTALLKTFRAN